MINSVFNYSIPIYRCLTCCILGEETTSKSVHHYLDEEYYMKKNLAWVHRNYMLLDSFTEQIHWSEIPRTLKPGIPLSVAHWEASLSSWAGLGQQPDAHPGAPSFPLFNGTGRGKRG